MSPLVLDAHEALVSAGMLGRAQSLLRDYSPEALDAAAAAASDVLEAATAGLTMDRWAAVNEARRACWAAAQEARRAAA